MAIWQDLVSDHGFPHGYQTVKRFVRKLARIGVVTGRAGHSHRLLHDGTMSTAPKTSRRAKT
jgi:hypothetical protein